MNEAVIDWGTGAIFLAGAVNIALAVFHLLFWRLFRWREQLPKLSRTNQGAMQIMNLCLIALFLFAAYLSFFHAGDLSGTALGHAILVAFAIFWLLRAGEQVFFFGLRRGLSVALTVGFVAMTGLYILPLAA